MKWSHGSGPLLRSALSAAAIRASTIPWIFVIPHTLNGILLVSRRFGALRDSKQQGVASPKTAQARGAYGVSKKPPETREHGVRRGVYRPLFLGEEKEVKGYEFAAVLKRPKGVSKMPFLGVALSTLRSGRKIITK